MRDIDPIKRGDVVIVWQGKFDYVKRVVGLPGDTVAMRDGIVFLNGIAVPQQALRDVERNDGDGVEKEKLLREQFPGEANAHQIYDLGVTPQDNVAAVTLKDGEFFMLGDNRDNSADSRFGYAEGGLGIVDRNRIKGRVIFRYWRKSVGLGEGKV